MAFRMLTTDQALELRKGDRIRVTQATRRHGRLAEVLDYPYPRHGRVVVPFAYVRTYSASGITGLGSKSHIAMLPADRVEFVAGRDESRIAGLR